MKKLFLFIILILTGCKTTTIYTPKDIYYLKWNRITSETGNVDRQFSHRGQALDYIEQRTADDCNSLLGDIYLNYNSYGEITQLYASKVFADYLNIIPVTPDNMGDFFYLYNLTPLIDCK